MGKQLLLQYLDRGLQASGTLMNATHPAVQVGTLYGFVQGQQLVPQVRGVVNQLFRIVTNPSSFDTGSFPGFLDG